jgi:hypothetical protein
MIRSTFRFRIREAVASLLLTIMIFASCGFSYNLHYCHGSLAEATFFPGLSHQPKGCGCETGSVPNVSGNEKQFPVHIQKTSCCKNFAYYEKINTVSFNDFSAISKLIRDLSTEAPLLPEAFEFQAAIESSSIRLVQHPPPVFGKTLVLYLHQIRIPSALIDC